MPARKASSATQTRQKKAGRKAIEKTSAWLAVWDAVKTNPWTMSVAGGLVIVAAMTAVWQQAPSANTRVAPSKRIAQLSEMSPDRPEGGSTMPTQPSAPQRSMAHGPEPPKGPELTRVRAQPVSSFQASRSDDNASDRSIATIAGCLMHDAQTFRLVDTTGEDAPTSRSWKSGFLRKSSVAIDVRDAGYGLNLAGNVGRRVSVTGVLADRSMQARSLRRVADSCN